MNQQILQDTEDLDEFMMVLANNSPSSDPLYIACVLGNFTIADLMVQSGTDVNSVPISIFYLQGRFLKTPPLGFPKSRKSKESDQIIFKLETTIWLLENGLSMYHKNKGLMYAIYVRNHDLIKILIEYGANVNIDNGLPLLTISCDSEKAFDRNGNIKIVDLLLKAGADVHVDNDIPLRTAFSRGHVKVVELLLNFGANIHIFVDEDLKSASSGGHRIIVAYLLFTNKNKYSDKARAREIVINNAGNNSNIKEYMMELKNVEELPLPYEIIVEIQKYL
jgi:ankyrin repeat protein